MQITVTLTGEEALAYIAGQQTDVVPAPAPTPEPPATATPKKGRGRVKSAPEPEKPNPTPDTALTAAAGLLDAGDGKEAGPRTYSGEEGAKIVTAYGQKFGAPKALATIQAAGKGGSNGARFGNLVDAEKQACLATMLTELGKTVEELA